MKHAHTILTVVLAAMLCLSSVLAAKFWYENRTVLEIRKQEAELAKSVKNCKFTVKPTDGLKFVYSSGINNPEHFVITYPGHSFESTNLKEPAFRTSGNNLLGIVDASGITPPTEHYTGLGTTLTPAFRILYRFLGQIGEQDSNWKSAGIGHFDYQGAVGYICHRTGILTLAVYPTGNPDMYAVEYTFAFQSRPARPGVINSGPYLPLKVALDTERKSGRLAQNR